MNLVIVESPTKARTIGRFLGKEYEIKASMGHVMDLPKNVLAVDTEHDFAPDYQPVSEKQNVVAELVEAAKTTDSVILATDPDREGEAIASHVRDMLSSNEKLKIKKGKFKRIVFHEITKEAIEQALKNPRTIDQHLVDAQTARRVLDRLVGYRLSPLLWQKIRRGLSAGRVQSVALRFIVEREREIEKFRKENYWTVHAQLQRAGRPPSAPVEFELIEINGEAPAGAWSASDWRAGKIEQEEKFDLYDGEYRVTKTTIDSQKQADVIVLDLQGKTFTVADVAKKEVHRSPHPPFTTSTLQQEGARRLGFSGRRTMRAAQKLYEEGFITYHRTDSVGVATSAVFAMRGFIEKEFGKKYVPEKPRFYKTKQRLAQEAHEAIRPTGLNNQPSTINKQLMRDYGKLYELIWRRAVASQMAEAVIESTTITVLARGPAAGFPPRLRQDYGGQAASVSAAVPREALRSGVGSPSTRVTPRSYTLKAAGSVLLFDGFLKVNPQAFEDKKLPELAVSDKLSLLKVNAQDHETTPPPRYSEALLIKTLEEKGIGRPSTYATIVETIENRRYVERVEGRFAPTPVGIAVNDFLVAHFSTVDDIPFTAEMEDNLDNIARGKKEWVPVVRTFYEPFEKKVEEVKETSKRVKIAVEPTDEKCPTCGANLVVRIGRFGRFLSCSTFPTCKFRKSFVEETNFMCPKDGGKIIVKRTRRGRKFFGCSNYPACDFAAWRVEDSKNPKA